MLHKHVGNVIWTHKEFEGEIEKENEGRNEGRNEGGGEKGQQVKTKDKNDQKISNTEQIDFKKIDSEDDIK